MKVGMKMINDGQEHIAIKTKIFLKNSEITNTTYDRNQKPNTTIINLIPR